MDRSLPSGQWPDAADWAKATRLGPFLRLGQREGAFSRLENGARLLQTEQFLFIRFEVSNPSRTPWINEGKARDEAVYKGDGVECHFENRDGSRLQFIVNASGVVFDSRDRDSTWNGTVDSRFESGEGVDFLTLRFARSDLLPHGNSTVKANFAVVQWRDGRLECSTFMPVERSLPESTDLATLDLGSTLAMQRTHAAAAFDDDEETMAKRVEEKRLRFGNDEFKLQETAYLSGRHRLVAQRPGPLTVERDLPVTSAGEKNFILTLEWSGHKSVGLEGRALDKDGNVLSRWPGGTLPAGQNQTIKLKWPMQKPPAQPTTLLLRFLSEQPDFSIRRIRFLPEGGAMQERLISENQADYRKAGAFSMDWSREPSQASHLAARRILFCIPGGDVDCERLSRRFHFEAIVAYDRDGNLLRRSAGESSLADLIEGNRLDAIVAAGGKPDGELEQTLLAAAKAKVPVLLLTQQAELWRDAFGKILGNEMTESDLAGAYQGLFPLKQFPLASRAGLFNGDAMISAIRLLKAGDSRVILVQCGGPDRLRSILPPASPVSPTYADWQGDFFAFLARLIRQELAATEPLMASLDAGQDHLTVRLGGSRSADVRLAVEFYALPESQRVYPRPVLIEEQTIPAAGSETAIPWPAALSEFTGTKLARVRLFDAENRLIDWGSATSRAEGTAEMIFPANEPEPVIPGKIPLQISRRNPGAGLSFVVELLCRDANDRLIDQRKEAIPSSPGGGRQSVVLQTEIKRTTTPGITAFVSLWDERHSKLLALAERRLEAPGKAMIDPDDFHLGINGDFFLRTHSDRDYVAWFKKLGVGSVMDGAHFYPSEELNMPWVHVGLSREIFTDHSSGTDRRKHNLSDPGVLQAAAEQALSNYERAARSRPLFTTFGDELELARDGAYEVDYSPVSVAAFREWLKKHYGTIAALNQAWKQSYENWDAIVPLHEEEARKAGQAALWVNFRRFMEDVWYDAYRKIRDAVKTPHPEAKLGFTNPFYLNPFSGENHYRSAKQEDVLAKYFRPDLIKQYRSFGRGKVMQTWFGYYEDVDVCRFYPFWFAFHGGKSVHFWSGVTTYSNYDVLDASGRETARSRAFFDAGKVLDRGAGLLLANVRSSSPPVGILSSQESMRVSYFHSTMKAKSAPWSRYGLAEEPLSNLFGEHIRSTQNILEIVKECQLQPEFYDLDHWEESAANKPSWLYAPFLAAVSERQLAALTAWVEGGGTLVCDVAFAMYDENGIPRRDSAPLQSLLGVGGYPGELVIKRDQVRQSGASRTPLGFGRLRHPVSARDGAAGATIGRETPAWIRHPVGKGHVVFLNFIPEVTPAMIAAFEREFFSALPRQARVEQEDGSQAIGYEVFPFQTDHARLAGIVRDMEPLEKGVRSAWFQGPIYRKAGPVPASQRIVFNRKYHIYEALEGRYEGEAGQVNATFPSGSARLYVLLGYRVDALELRQIAPDSPKAGMAIDLQLDLKLSKDVPMTPHVITVDVLSPEGAPLPAYRQKLTLREPSIAVRIPTALDDSPGSYRVLARDAISGKTANSVFTLTSP